MKRVIISIAFFAMRFCDPQIDLRRRPIQSQDQGFHHFLRFPTVYIAPHRSHSMSRRLPLFKLKRGPFVLWESLGKNFEVAETKTGSELILI